MKFDDLSLTTFFDQPILRSEFDYGAFGYALDHCGTSCRLEFNAVTGNTVLTLESSGNCWLIDIENCERIVTDGNTLQMFCSGKQCVLLTKHSDHLSCVGRIAEC